METIYLQAQRNFPYFHYSHKTAANFFVYGKLRLGHARNGAISLPIANAPLGAPTARLLLS
jgi:hypothetical protein